MLHAAFELTRALPGPALRNFVLRGRAASSPIRPRHLAERCAKIATIRAARTASMLHRANAIGTIPMDLIPRIRQHFSDSAQLKLNAAESMAPVIVQAADLFTECLLGDGKLLACGNGGSASDAQHFAAEMVGRL